MYSLRMSFWVVPLIRARSTPCSSAAATYRARRIGAVALIVIEVETSPSGSPSSRTCMSASDEIGTPTRPTSPFGGRRVRVVAHLGRQVERDRQAGLALVQQVAEALVGLLGRGEPGVLAHRPEAAAVHRRLDAPGERVLAGPPEVPGLVEAGDVGRRVEVTDLDAGRGLEPLAPLRGGLRAPWRGGSPASDRGAGRRPPRRGALGCPSLIRGTTSRSPISTVDPAAVADPRTVPARGARSSFCIFIASTTSSA